MSTLFDLSPADVADTSDDRYTPRWIFDAADVVFDLDVSAPVDPTRRTCPARRYLTPVEDGLSQPWEGVVWMNPPYSEPHRWIDKFAAHGNGLALLPAFKRASWLGALLGSADAMTLLSPVFSLPSGASYEVLGLTILAACGPVAVDALARVAAADKYVRGAYHVRPGVKLNTQEIPCPQ